MSTITVRIGRSGQDAEVVLTLPAERKESEAILSALDVYRKDAPLELRAVRCEVPGLLGYLRRTDLDRPGELDKLNHLAELLENMDREQRDLLPGALDMEPIGGMEDVLRVARDLDSYEKIPGVVHETDLGRYLVDSGTLRFPDYVKPYLDYRAIGIEYHAEHSGAFTNSGYVRRKGPAPALEMEDPRDTVLTAYLQNEKTGGTYALKLPASAGRMEAAKRALGVPDLEKVTIQELDWADHEFEGLEDLDRPSLEMLDRLAKAIHDHVTTPEQRATLLAACEAMGIDRWDEMLEIAEGLDDFELFRVSDPSEYGRQLAEKMAEENYDMLVELDDYIDFTQFGEDKMQENGIRETNYGYVARLSEPLPEEQDFSQTFQ